MKNELLVTECSYENTTIDFEVLDQIGMIDFECENMRDKILDSDEKIDQDKLNRMVHGFVGLKTEIGELYDAYKKHWFYGKPLDLHNVEEEIGDLIWYTELLEDCKIDVSTLKTQLDNFAFMIRTTYEACRENVIKKLRVRYPDGFTEFDAENRDTEKEMEAFTGEQK